MVYNEAEGLGKAGLQHQTAASTPASLLEILTLPYGRKFGGKHAPTLPSDNRQSWGVDAILGRRITVQIHCFEPLLLIFIKIFFFRRNRKDAFVKLTILITYLQ